jgi:hypothetical protein
MAKVEGSVALTPYSSFVKKRVSIGAPAIPTATPIAV